MSFYFQEEVKKIHVTKGVARSVETVNATYTADAVISGADYHFTEMTLLDTPFRSYKESYWQKKIMAPSALLYYVGLNKKLPAAMHHMLFFDVPFEPHGEEIYTRPAWPSEPLFYASVSSVTDRNAAPADGESMVLLVPVASGLAGDNEELREKYFSMIIRRMEKHLGEPILDSVVVKRSYAVSDFMADYNSFKGNAYGLANTLWQTALFRPSCHSKKVANLFYTGQLTVPGPGVPPSLISGEVVAKEVIKKIR